jgi:hypothetical protein
MSEFDRLFEEFKNRDPQDAELWRQNVDALGVLSEVCALTVAYERQNQEIHAACLRCNPSVPCQHKQRELDWIEHSGPWKFPFEECGLSGLVSYEAWEAFAILLSCSEHASVREWLSAQPGCHLAPEQLWDPDGTEWQERLARRFAPIRHGTERANAEPAQSLSTCP